MPLHGKIVVIKRSGGDGTEFPLTASCLFGRKPDCDIRIQLPQVSKEHCRIELNENKEVILTNLSSVNPTCVNGEALQQSERLKHGDIITIIDRSFRFEYPPAPTPKKKRSSLVGKSETLRVLQDQQVSDTTTAEAGRKTSEVTTDSYLKDGANHDNIQRSLEKAIEVETTEDGNLDQSKTSSPFNELYQIIKQTLDIKTPRKSSISLPQTPASRFYAHKPVSVRKVAAEPAISTEVKSTPKKVDEESSGTITTDSNAEGGTSLDVPVSQGTGLTPDENKPAEQAAKSTTAIQETPRSKRCSSSSRTPTTEAVSTPASQNSHQTTPQRFTVSEVVEQVNAEKPKTPTRRSSKQGTPIKATVTEAQKEQTEAQPSTPKPEATPRTSPRSLEKKLKAQDVPRELEAAASEKQVSAKKRKSGELGVVSKQKTKKKRVSFGGQLSPEFFDKRLPPDSPLCKGAMPRRSLCVPKPKLSLLRRASVIGLVKESGISPKGKSPAKKRTPSPAKRSPKAKTPSPKASAPAKRSPKAKTPSPKASSPARKSPNARTPSPSKKKSPKTKAKIPSPGKSEVASSPGRKSLPAADETPSPARGRSSSKDEPETPKAQRKSTSPAQPQSVDKKTPTGKRRSSPLSTATPQKNTATVVAVTPAKIPSSKSQTPTVQGRFSVSRISEQDAVAVPEPSVDVTPKLPLKRRSMKSTSKRTPKSVVKSAVEVMRRRSGVSRASMKVVNSWADIVKFGQTKSQMVVPAKKPPTKTKAKKAVVPKPKTPARKLEDHVSTGHADSPMTIVVGRAYRQKILHPTGAAPKLVENIALLKKNLKMDEDLTGIAEIFSTPVNVRQRKSVIGVQTATKTPQTALSTSEIEASVMNTPEETGEMAVSPLSVVSTAKRGRYNKEAVIRLLESDQETSFVSEIPALEMPTDDSTEQQTPDLQTEMSTPKQRPAQPDCLTGVKRLMKTPKQKAEPIEDLRGKLLKTPRQKTEQHECLTGVKRLMKTPRQTAKPVEDLRGKLLKTPRVPKAAEEVDFDGVKELLETPKRSEESVEDLAEVMGTKTPKRNNSPLVCATGIKRMMKTPEQKGEPVENFGIQRLMKTPRLMGNTPVEDLEGQQELMEEPQSDLGAHTDANEGQDETSSDTTENVPQEDMTKEIGAVCEAQPEDGTCTPGEDGPMDVLGNVPQEDTAQGVVCEEQQPPADGPSDTTEDVPQEDTVLEPEVVCEQPEETSCSQDEDGSSDTVENVPQEITAQEPEVVCEEQPEDVTFAQGEDGPSDTRDNIPQEDEAVEAEVVCEEKPEDVSCTQGENGPSDTVENVVQEDETQEVVSEEQTEDIPCAQGEDGPSNTVENLSREDEEKEAEVVCEEKPEDVPCAQGEDGPSDTVENVVQEDETQEPAVVCEEQPEDVPCAQDENEPSVSTEDIPQAAIDQHLPEVEPAVTEGTTSSAPEPQKRSAGVRKAKTVEPKVADTTEQPEETTVPTPVRGRRGKKTEVAAPPMVRQTARSRVAKANESNDVEVPVEASESVAPQEAATLKPRRGRNAKQASLEQAETMLENTVEAMSAQTPLTDVEPEVTESVVPQKAATLKPKRGRSAKQVSLDQAELVQENADTRDETHPIDNVELRVSDTVVVSQEETTLKPRRGRNAKQASLEQAETMTVEAMSAQTPLTDVEPDVTESVVPQKAATLKPKRGRNAKQFSLEQAELVQENAYTTRDETHPIDNVEPRVSDIVVVSQEETTLKPRRGRNAKKASVEQAETVQENTMEVLNDQAPPNDNVEPGVSDMVAPQEEAASKPRRGRKGKQVSIKQASVEQAPTVQENAEVLNDEPPPTEDGHTQEPITMNDEPLPTEDVQAQESIPTVTVEKPRRGRKTKQDSVEQSKVVIEDPVKAVETEQVAQAPVRAKRGRKTKQDSEEKAEADVEIPPVESVEIKEPVEKPSRVRNAKQDSVEQAESVEVLTVETPVAEKMAAPAPISKPGRGKKSKQDSVDPAEEPPMESAIVETPAEATEVHEQTAVAPADKPRRGGRKTKQDADDVIPPESTEVQDKPSANLSEKPRRGRKTKQEKVDEEVVTISQEPDEKAEAKQEEVQEDEVVDAEPVSNPAEQQLEAPAVKTTRGRKANSAVKEEISQVTPAKRARRGAAHSLQETAAVEATVPISKSAPRGRAGKQSKAEETDNPAEVPAEPARKGRKAAAKPAVVAADNARAVPSTEKMEEEEVAPVEAKKGRAPRKGKAASEASSDQANDVVEDTEIPGKSVNWKTELTETHAVTPVVRAARGRKAKLVDEDKDEASQAIPAKRGCRSAESAEPSTPQATASKPVNKRKVSSKAEKEDLSDKAVPAEPVKRTRRGAMATDSAPNEAITPVTEEVSESTDEAPDKGRGKAPRKGKAVSKTVDNVKPVEPEMQPRPRRGRPAKK